MSQKYVRMYHRRSADWSAQAGSIGPCAGPTAAGAGASPAGTNQSSRPHQPPAVAGRQPSHRSTPRMTVAKTHSGRSSRRARLRMTAPAGRASERAISDPASANMTPIAGKTMLSQPTPVKVW